MNSRKQVDRVGGRSGNSKFRDRLYFTLTSLQNHRRNNDTILTNYNFSARPVRFVVTVEMNPSDSGNEINSQIEIVLSLEQNKYSYVDGYGVYDC